MSRTIDKIISEISKSSNSTMLQKYQSTHYQTNRIIDLTDRKRKIVNLKVIVEEVISRLSKGDRRVLTLVYIDGVRSEDASNLLGVSLRTFFRKKVNALREFSLILQALGYDEEFFESEYFCEKWFMSVYDNCVSRDTYEEESLNRYLIKCMFGEISKVARSFNTYLN